MKPTKKHLRYVDSVIAALQAFKLGKPIQRRGRITTNNKWVDFDLREFLDKEPSEYRPKKIRTK